VRSMVVVVPVGAGNCVTSRDLLIFVDQPAEAITSTHLRSGWPQQPNHGPIGWSLIQRPVRSMPVEVIYVLGQHLFEVAPTDDQRPIQTLAADTAHPTFRDRVRTRRLDWAAQHVHAGRREHRVERGRELGVTITDQKPASYPPARRGP
jgi:hypothetical protein